MMENRVPHSVGATSPSQPAVVSVEVSKPPVGPQVYDALIDVICL